MAGRADDVLARYLAGDLPANVALMQLIVEASAPEEVAAFLDSRAAGPDGRAARHSGPKLDALRALARAHPEAWSTVRAVMAEADHERTDPARWAAVFDRLARSAPEAGVALYGLGSPELLRAATAEVVARLRDWGLTGAHRTLVELGCGYGRLSLALAGEFGSVLGLDISGAMIAEARARAGADARLRFEQTDGRDLALVPDASADLILAADVFPYLVMGGPELAARHVDEAARALKPGGALVILNYSYRGDEAVDRREVGSGFARAGLSLDRNGTRDLDLWDARAFVGRKRP